MPFEHPLRRQHCERGGGNQNGSGHRWWLLAFWRTSQVPGRFLPAGFFCGCGRGLLFLVQVTIGLRRHVELQLVVAWLLFARVISTSCSVTMRGSAAMPLTNAPIEWKLPVRRILIGNSA